MNAEEIAKKWDDFSTKHNGHSDEKFVVAHALLDAIEALEDVISQNDGQIDSFQTMTAREALAKIRGENESPTS